MLRTWLAASIFLTLFADRTLAQSPSPLESIAAKPDELARHHVGLHGNPCIALDSYVKAQVINKNIYEHWIAATNSCQETIKLQICYHNSSNCIVMALPPWQSKNSVLGIYPA
jgi:hypothetical protein